MKLEKKENISGKVSNNAQEIPIGENYSEIERAKLLVAKVLQAEALYITWEQKDIKFLLEGEKIVWQKRLWKKLQERLWGGYGECRNKKLFILLLFNSISCIKLYLFGNVVYVN